MKVLIIRQPWADMILDGMKTWEMRARRTTVRGRIGIAVAGTGMIYGEATVTDSPDIPIAELHTHVAKHLIHDSELLARWRHPWVIERAERYRYPRPYRHPRGAVVWVNE